MSRSAPPKQVRAVAERVAGQPPQVLAVVGQQREVVGDEVAGGDRDQRVRERARERAPVRRRRRRRIPRMPSVQIAPTISTAPARPTTNAELERRARCESPRSRKKPCRSCAMSLNSAPSLAPSNAVEPIETTSSAPRAGDGREPRRAGERHAQLRRGRRRRGRAARASRSARTGRRTRPRCAPTARRRTGSSRRASRRGRRASGSRAARARCARAQHSSQIAKREQPDRGRDAGRAAPGTRAAPAARRKRPATQPVARPSARHGLNSRKTSPNSSDRNGMPTQKPT